MHLMTSEEAASAQHSVVCGGELQSLCAARCLPPRRHGLASRNMLVIGGDAPACDVPITAKPWRS
jgi:hypothetical protein